MMIQKGSKVKSKVTGKIGKVIRRRINIANRSGYEEQYCVLWDGEIQDRWVPGKFLLEVGE